MYFLHLRQEVKSTKMIKFTRKKKHFTEDNIILNRLKIGCMLMLAVLLVSLPVDMVKAASGLRLYNHSTKREINYTDKQVRVTYNGSKISVDSTPGILVNGVALVSYQDIFNKSAIKASCVYDKAKGTVTISKYGTTIVMTLNSRTARVNGKAVTMPVAPVMIKYIKANSTKILVPSRFVSETLGFQYAWNSSTNTVAITKNSMSLSYNGGKAFEYKGTQALVSLDGKNINMGSMPNIIHNNTVLLRAKKVFGDTLKAKYSYNSSKKTVTLSKNDNEIVMKIGDTVAYLNGKPVILDTAPLLVRNNETNTSFVMVPGSITAAALGYDYAWNRDKRTAAITTRKTINQNSNDVKPPVSDNKDITPPAPELGDVSVEKKPSRVVLELLSKDTNLGKSLDTHNLNVDDIPGGTPGFVYEALREYAESRQNVETYVLSSTLPFGKITSTKEKNLITIQVPNAFTYDQIYPFGGDFNKLVDNIKTSFDQKNNCTVIELTVIPEQFTYELSLSEDKLSLNVSIFMNSLEGITIGTNGDSDYISLKGVSPLNVTVTTQDSLMYIELPFASNGIGDQNIQVADSKNIMFLSAITTADRTLIILGLDQYRDFYVSEEENIYTIAFTKPVTEETNGMNDLSNYQIIIPRPSGISNDKITHADYYLNQKFAIKIPGDHTAFFAKNKVTNKSSVVTNVTVKLNSKNETEIVFTTSRLQGYKFDMDNKNIYVRIGNPRDIYKNIVVLDAGHGGTDPGAIYNGVREKDLNFTMLYDMGRKHFDSNNSPIKVYYTRTTDVFITLKDRAAFASKVGADLFVSLHMNAATNTAASGTEVYYSLSNNAPNNAGLTSKALATLMVNNLSSNLGTRNRGAKYQQYTVVHTNTVPAILIELGFMSNKDDFALITNKTNQEKSAKVIYDTLCKVFELYPTGR